MTDVINELDRPEALSRLQLVRAQLDGLGDLQVFESSEKAARHLRDHLLTPPESEAWALVAPEIRAVLPDGSDDSLFRFWREVVDTEAESAQPLYEAYARSIEFGAREALRLGWVAEEMNISVFFSTSGVLTLSRSRGGARVVLTSYLPGQGDPNAVRAQAKGQQTRSAATTRRMRAGSWKNDRLGHAEQERRVKREASWTTEQRIYYRVFRPAISFLRRSHLDPPTTGPYGARNRNEYALLKNTLFSEGSLTFESWTARRVAGTSEAGTP